MLISSLVASRDIATMSTLNNMIASLLILLINLDIKLIKIDLLQPLKFFFEKRDKIIGMLVDLEFTSRHTFNIKQCLLAHDSNIKEFYL